MNLEKYWELLRELFRWYDEEKYSEILNYLQTANIDFPYGKAALYYSGICAAAKLGKNSLAIELITQIIDEGGWYSEFILTQSPSLQPLQQLPEFQKQLNRSIELSVPELQKTHEITIFPENKPPYPLMLGLHADSGVIDEEIEFWHPVIERGFAVGMPRSTNVYWSGKDSAYWPDHELALQQLEEYLKKINKLKSIDFHNSLVGGLSAGAELAIWLAVSGRLSIRKFVAVAPGGRWMNDLEKWQPLIDESNTNDVRGMIITGKQDKVISLENIKMLVEILTDNGILCNLFEYSEIGHW